MSFTPASKALARFKVLDLTRVRAGPTAARQFADWGAESSRSNCPRVSTRATWAGRGTGPISRTFIATSEAYLNLKEPDGIAIFKRMVETADVVIENYRPD